MSGGVPPQSPRRRRTRVWAIVAAAVVVLAAAAVVVVAVTGGDGGPGSAAPAPSSSGSSSGPGSAAVSSAASTGGAAPSVSVPSDPVAAAESIPTSLAPVPLGGSASSSGVSVSLPSVVAIKGQATGPGNIGGPAVRVTVRIHDDGSAPFSLDGVSVNLAYGSDLKPASPLDDPSAAPFHGTVRQGATAEGTYVFTVPADDRSAVTVEVQPAAGAPVALFTGPVR